MSFEKHRLREGCAEILFVSHASHLFGAERSLLDLVLNVRDDYSVCVIVPSRGPMLDVLERNRVPYVVVNHKAWIGNTPRFLRIPFRLFFNVRALFLAKGLFKGCPPKVIYTNSISKPLGALLSWQLGVPHIWHIREFVKEGLGLTYDYGEELTMKMVRLTTDHMICNSACLRSKMSSYVSSERISVIYNGVLDGGGRDTFVLKKVPRICDKEVQLCIVGSLHPAKGQLEAVQCLGLLKSRGIRVVLRIVGSGEKSYENKIYKLAEKLGLLKDISFDGFSTSVLETLASVDICLICSWQEAFGRVAVEAMSVGTPVIATNSGGIPEIIKHGETGLLYPSGRVEILAKMAQKLINSPSLYQKISINGRKEVFNKFNKCNYVEEIKDVFRKIIC